MNEQKNMPASDWEGEGAKIFRPEDLVRNDLQKKLEMLMPGVPKERITALVDQVQGAKTPDYSWVPEAARGPVLEVARESAQAFDRIATAKVEADLAAEERAKSISKLQAQDEAERQEVIATFRDQFAEEKQAIAKPKLSPEVKSKAGILNAAEINRAIAGVRAKEEMNQPSIIVEDLEAMNREAEKRRREQGR